MCLLTDMHTIYHLILKKFTPVEDHAKIIIYEPGFNNQTARARKEKKLTPVRAMLLIALNKYKIPEYSILSQIFSFPCI
jgi:hypothetical protein